MAAVQKRIVHKQFNSPIGLYSENNIKQVLDRELKQLSNGSVGIDFANNPNTTVPPTLAKSAVLRALEEEEREKKGLKRVAWPPPPADGDLRPRNKTPVQFYQQDGANTDDQPQQFQQQQQVSPQPQQQSVFVPAPVARPQSPPRVTPTVSSNLFAGGNVPPSKTAPLSVSSGFLSTTPSTLSPASPKGWKPVKVPLFAAGNAAPNRPMPAAPTSYVPPPFDSFGVAPVPAPAPDSAPAPTYQPAAFVSGYQQTPYQPQPAPQAFQAVANTQPSPTLNYSSSVVQPQQPHQQLYQGQQQQTQYESSSTVINQSSITSTTTTSGNQYPGLITQLRKEPPVSQAPSPVFPSQPATAKLRGGSNMRGDQKWPPMEYKARVAEEQEAARQIALGPAFRPKRPAKDYTPFFAQHALPSTYSGYRVPPGTQHVGEADYLTL